PDLPIHETTFLSLIASANLDTKDDVAVARAAKGVLTLMLEDKTIIDFDDMLYLPLILGVRPRTFDYVFIDEAQDTNRVQLEFLKLLCNPRTRVIAVGDRHQSIYGFR